MAARHRCAESVVLLVALQVAFDPLDGSSILGANFAVGAIFGIWRGNTLLGVSGKDQVAAAYAVFGPATVLVLACSKTGPRLLLYSLHEWFSPYRALVQALHIVIDGLEYAGASGKPEVHEFVLENETYFATYKHSRSNITIGEKKVWLLEWQLWRGVYDIPAFISACACRSLLLQTCEQPRTTWFTGTMCPP